MMNTITLTRVEVYTGPLILVRFTEKYVALPSRSEHQTGLAIDLGLKKEIMDFICPEFPYEGICNEFRKEAICHGFIERYQSGKEDITGIGHEPWHFRYVGYPHSEIMNLNQLALEEYVEFIKGFPYGQKHLQILGKGQRIEICYIPLPAVGTVTIAVDGNTDYQVSGNNMDGLIITLWRNHNGES